MIALTLPQGIPEGIGRGALEPSEQNLWNVEDDIEHGNGDQTAADLGVYVKQLRLDNDLAHFKSILESLNILRIASEQAWKGKELTALSIHLNEKRCHRDLSRRNGQVEKEDRDPCEKEIITQLASFLDGLKMISKSMEN
jgi:hypothetical protein